MTEVRLKIYNILEQPRVVENACRQLRRSMSVELIIPQKRKKARYSSPSEIRKEKNMNSEKKCKNSWRGSEYMNAAKGRRQSGNSNSNRNFRSKVG